MTPVINGSSVQGLQECGWHTNRYGKSNEPPCPELVAHKQQSTDLVEDGLCVFHSKDREKDLEEFNAALKAMAERQDFRCAGWGFPSRLQLQDTSLRTADFTLAVFHDGAD